MKIFVRFLLSLSLCIQSYANESDICWNNAHKDEIYKKLLVKKQTQKRLKKYALCALIVALTITGSILGVKKVKNKNNKKNKNKDTLGLYVDIGLKCKSKTK